MKIWTFVCAASLAGLVGLAGCGGGDEGADIHVSTSGGSSDGSTPGVVDTVVQKQVTVDTIVHQRTDTVVLDNRTPMPDTAAKPVVVTASERRLIDLWLMARRDSVNEFGDATGTYYAGGTPLFDEATGQKVDRYEYIMRKHPDRPWRSTK